MKIRFYRHNTFRPEKKRGYFARPGSSFPAITSFKSGDQSKEQVTLDLDKATNPIRRTQGQLKKILKDSASANISLVLAPCDDPDNVAATLQEVTRLHLQKLSERVNVREKDQIIIIVPSEVPYAFTEQLPKIQDYIDELHQIENAKSKIQLCKIREDGLNSILLEAISKKTTIAVSNLDNPGRNNMMLFILENSLESGTLEKVDRYSASKLAKELNIKYLLVADHHEDKEGILREMINEIVNAGPNRQGWALDSHAAAVSLDAMVWYQQSIKQLKESSENLYTKLMEFVQAGVNTDLFYGFLAQDSNNKKYESKHPIGRFFSSLYKYPWLIKALGLEENFAQYKQDLLVNNKRVPILREGHRILQLIRSRAEEYVQSADEKIDKRLARIFFQNPDLEPKIPFPFTEMVAQSYANQILNINPIVGEWKGQKFLMNIVHPPLPTTDRLGGKNSILNTLTEAHSRDVSTYDIRRTIGRIIDRAHQLILQQIEIKEFRRNVLDVFKLANKISFLTMFRIISLVSKSNSQILGSYFKTIGENVKYSQLISLPSLTIAIADVGKRQILVSGRKVSYSSNQDGVDEFHVGNFLTEATRNIIGGNHNQGAATIDLNNNEILQVMERFISNSIMRDLITENTTDSELVELFLKACIFKQNKTQSLEAEFTRIQNLGILSEVTENY